MANKFLNSSSENANLSNGTIEIFGSTIGASNLSGSQCIKTNAMRQLISSDINISDVIGLQSSLNNVIKNPYNGYITATGFKTSSAVGGVPKYLLDDGSTASAIVVGGQSNIYYYDNSTINTPPPSSGQIRFNNAIQQNATLLYVSHQTSNPITDVDPFLALIADLSIIYIQDRSDSTNWIKYKVNGIPTTVVNSYWTIPVLYDSGNGTGLTNFPNAHNIFMSVFVDATEENTRIGLLEDKTLLQSRDGYTTNFLYPGTSGSMYYLALNNTVVLSTSIFAGTTFTSTTPFALVQYSVNTTYLSGSGNTRDLNVYQGGTLYATFTFDKTVISGGSSVFTFPANYILPAGTYSVGLVAIVGDTVYIGTYFSFIASFINITYATSIPAGGISQGFISVNTQADTTIRCDHFVSPNAGSSLLRGDGTYDSLTENKTFNQSRTTTITSFIGTESSSNVKMYSYTSGGSWATSGFSGITFTASKAFKLIRFAHPTAFLGSASATRVISIFKNNILLNDYTLTKSNVDGLGFSFYDWGTSGLALDIGDYKIGLTLISNNDFAYYIPVYTSNYPFFTNILRTNPDNGSGDLTISYILDYTIKSDRFIAPYGGTGFLKADGSYDSKTYLPITGGTLTGDLLQPLAPSVSNSLTNKNYVDTRDALKLNLTGGILSGALTVGSGTYGIIIQPPTTGYNIIIGASGGGINSSYTGGSSVFIGDSAGLNITTQLNNTYVGSFSGNANTNLYNNATAIGYNAQNTVSNQVSLGDANITEVLTAGFYKGAGFKTPTGTSSDVLLANGTTTTITALSGTKELELSYILATFVGIQYQHASGLNTTMSNSLWSALGSTSSAASTYAITNNFTRQLCSANWTFPTQADGQCCGYGSTITTGAQVNTKFPFGIYFSGGISDTAFSGTGTAVPQNFWGLWNLSTAIPLNSTTQLLSRRDLIGFGSSQADANICIFTCSASVSIKAVDLGSSFPANRTSGAVSTDIFQLALWWDLTKVYYKAVNTTLNITVSGSFTPTVMPTNTISLYPQCCRIAGSGGTASSCRLQVQRFGVYY